MIDENELYTTSQVATFLKVSPITVKRYIANNKIKSLKINGLRRIKGKDILSLIGDDMNKTRVFKTIDLFAGVGGIRLGFEKAKNSKAKFKTVFSNDFEAKCKNTFDLNFSEPKLTVGDIREIASSEIPHFDFLLAGFPCQAFSIAGYRQGFDDEKGRGNLFFDVHRIIKERNPKGFLLENVKNLVSHDKGKTFSIIKQSLEELGYHLKYKVLNSKDYGNLPQNRERIYVVGFKNAKHWLRFQFPKQVSLTYSFRDLLEDDVDDIYYYNDKPLYPRIKDHIISKSSVYQWRRKYVRENKSGVCPTLTANMGTGGHNVPIIKVKKGIRKLTPRECFMLQGFGKSFKIPTDISNSALYMQAGNSVTVPVIKRIANSILDAMV